LTTFR